MRLIVGRAYIQTPVSHRPLVESHSWLYEVWFAKPAQVDPEGVARCSCALPVRFLVVASPSFQPTADLGRNAMKRLGKEVVVAELTVLFRNAGAVHLTEFRGLAAVQISDLGEKLGRDTSYTVAKNARFRIASKEAGIEGLEEMLIGPSAVVFVKGDFIDAVKTLRDFAKTSKALIIKGRFADGTVYDAEGAKQPADLESRPELLAELSGALKGTMSKAAYLFNVLPTKVVRAVDALREKQEKAAWSPCGPPHSINPERT